MEDYYIDFRGFCKIKANSKEDAQERFWKDICPPSKESFDAYYEVEGIEKSLDR